MPDIFISTLVLYILFTIFKELKTDIPNFKIPDHGCLESWACQGVFMLNATLTVE